MNILLATVFWVLWTAMFCIFDINQIAKQAYTFYYAGVLGTVIAIGIAVLLKGM